MPDIERDRLAAMVKKIMGVLLERAPDDAFPLFVSRESVRTQISAMIDKLDTEDMLEMAMIAHLELDKLFQGVTKEWMLGRLDARSPGLRKVMDAMEGSGVAYFH